jgi:methylmalonyl-CoA/ethylmalonyl-CoA epimerase
MSSGLDHVAILVADLDAAVRLYRDVYGLAEPEIEEVPSEKVRVAIFGHGAGRIELVSPTGPDSPMQKALEKRGEGLHHVCLSVPDIEKAMAALRAPARRRSPARRRRRAGRLRPPEGQPRGAGGAEAGVEVGAAPRPEGPRRAPVPGAATGGAEGPGHGRPRNS